MVNLNTIARVLSASILFWIMGYALFWLIISILAMIFSFPQFTSRSILRFAIYVTVVVITYYPAKGLMSPFTNTYSTEREETNIRWFEANKYKYTVFSTWTRYGWINNLFGFLGFIWALLGFLNGSSLIL